MSDVQTYPAGAGPVATPGGPLSYIHWGPVIAGAVVAAAVWSVLMAFAAAVGMMIASPSPTWRDTSVWLALLSGLWIVVVTAGMVLGGSAGLHDLAIGQNQLQTQDMVDRDSVFQSVRPTGVGGGVAADRAGSLATRIRGEMVGLRLQMFAEPFVDDARLNDGISVPTVDFQNSLHPGQSDHHSAAYG